MPIAYDPAKAASNLAKHGVGFDAVEGFAWDAALVVASLGSDEPRLLALGLIGDRLHVLVFSIETATLRVISLRKANSRKFDRYVRQV